MKLFLKIIIPIALIAGGVFGLKSLKASAPEPKSQPQPVIIPEAPVIEVSPASHAPPVRSFSTVEPFFQTKLTPQVSGQIIEVSPRFRVGHRVAQGEVLVRLDFTDFDTALSARQAELSTAQQALAEEEVRAEQAAEDWKASGRKITTASPFVLRQPQLEAARARIDSLQSAIEKAEADLDRTVLRAPFDAIVTARSASRGNYASPQGDLGSLVATERVLLSLPLTPEQVRRIDLPREEGKEQSRVQMTSPLHPETIWQGRLTRTVPTVSRDQVLNVIAEVTDPFTSEPPLLLGTFCNVEISARTLENSYQIPEAALVDDRYLWSLDSDNRLVRLDATRAHADGETLYVWLEKEPPVSPLRLLTRPLTNFKPGQEVRPLTR